MKYFIIDALQTIFIIVAVIGTPFLIAWIWSSLSRSLNFDGALLWTEVIINGGIYLCGRLG